MTPRARGRGRAGRCWCTSGFCHWGLSRCRASSPASLRHCAVLFSSVSCVVFVLGPGLFIFSSLECGVAAVSRDIVLLRVPWRPFHTAVPFYETQMLWAGCVQLTATLLWEVESAAPAHLWGSTVLPVCIFKIQTSPSFLFVWLFLKFNKVQSKQKSELTGYVRAWLFVVINASVTASSSECGDPSLASPAVLAVVGAERSEQLPTEKFSPRAECGSLLSGEWAQW